MSSLGYILGLIDTRIEKQDGDPGHRLFLLLAAATQAVEVTGIAGQTGLCCGFNRLRQRNEAWHNPQLVMHAFAQRAAEGEKIRCEKRQTVRHNLLPMVLKLHIRAESDPSCPERLESQVRGRSPPNHPKKGICSSTTS